MKKKDDLHKNFPSMKEKQQIFTFHKMIQDKQMDIFLINQPMM